MLPMKLNLTNELAAILRKLRLENPVNGEIYTAEKLSKAIGKNRAWMSQIESRRLKKIRREDIIALYKFLFNISSDYVAEDKAEEDLFKFIVSDTKTMIVAHPKMVEKHTNSPSQNACGNQITDLYSLNCKAIYDLLMDIYRNSDDPNEKLSLAQKIDSICKEIHLGGKYSIDILSKLPLHYYKYANKEEREKIDEKVLTLSYELKKLQYKDHIHSFINEIKEIDLCTEKIFIPSSITSSICLGYLLLIDIVFNSPLSHEDKIYYINQFISVIKKYISKKNLLFVVDLLKPDASINDINNTMDYLQSFINSLKGTQLYLLNHVSKFKDNDVN